MSSIERLGRMLHSSAWRGFSVGMPVMVDRGDGDVRSAVVVGVPSEYEVEVQYSDGSKELIGDDPDILVVPKVLHDSGDFNPENW